MIQAIFQITVIAHLHVTGAIHLRYIFVFIHHITGSEGQVSGGLGKGGAIVKIANTPNIRDYLLTNTVLTLPCPPIPISPGVSCNIRHICRLHTTTYAPCPQNSDHACPKLTVEQTWLAKNAERRSYRYWH